METMDCGAKGKFERHCIASKLTSAKSGDCRVNEVLGFLEVMRQTK